MTVYIQPELRHAFEASIEQIANSMPLVEERCPRCRWPIRYPLIARERDLELFAHLMESLEGVIRRNQLTIHLLAELKAQIAIDMARTRR
jgi:hypothetical protein